MTSHERPKTRPRPPGRPPRPPLAPAPVAFDPTLLDLLASCTPEQRLEWLCAHLRGIRELRDGLHA